MKNAAYAILGVIGVISLLMICVGLGLIVYQLGYLPPTSRPTSVPTPIPTSCSADVLQRFETLELAQKGAELTQSMFTPGTVESHEWRISSRGEGCVITLYFVVNGLEVASTMQWYVVPSTGRIAPDGEVAAQLAPYYPDVKLPSE